MADEPVLVITGASTGIGAATASRAIEFGYRVVLAARSEDKLERLAGELGGQEKAMAVRCDVTSWEDAGVVSQPSRPSWHGRLLRQRGLWGGAGFLEDRSAGNEDRHQYLRLGVSSGGLATLSRPFSTYPDQLVAGR